MKLDWTGPALADIREIDRYLLLYSPEKAARTLESIADSANILESFPAIGPVVDDTTRSLRVRNSPYLLLYRVHGTAIEILRVRHDRQDWRAI